MIGLLVFGGVRFAWRLHNSWVGGENGIEED
jgi:hypothetical protein